MFSLLTEVDRYRLVTLLDQFAPPARAFLERSLMAAADFDHRPLSGVLLLVEPTLRVIPLESRLKILERVAQLSRVFPAGVASLFRTLGRVFDEGGEQRTLEWIATGESVGGRNADAGTAFFALRSRTSLLAIRGASPAVYLSDVQGLLVKYLHMLSGTAVGLTEVDTLSFPPPLAVEEGILMPLPFCIDRFPTYEENFRLYRVLVAHHAGRVEFGTYTCSPARLWSNLSPFVQRINSSTALPVDDLISYFHFFPRPDLIESLFLAVEGKRITPRLVGRYPGLRADLMWADTLLSLMPPETAVVVSQLPDSAWRELGATGTVSQTLVLATRLYVEFFEHESRFSAVRDNSRFDGSGFGEEDTTGFLTGVELEAEPESPLLGDAARAERRRRALTAADLRHVYDEWDYEIDDYRPHWCELREIALPGDEGAFFSKTLTMYPELIREIKREFQRLRPRMLQAVKGLEDGEDIDLNATVSARIDRLVGNSPSTKLYSARQLIERDVAVLLLLDLSASTAKQIDETREPTAAARRDGRKVIDVVKEAVTILAVALEEIGDAYAIYGFSSSGRYDVEVYPVKTFRDELALEVQGRIGGLTPRGGTRMGTAVRHVTRRLKSVASRTKLLVLLSDGYPEDAGYGKPVVPPTYGLRDTAMALREAERCGIIPFCLTVDKGGHDYLREMCASSRYMMIEDVLSLPRELPKIYQRHIRTQLAL